MIQENRKILVAFQTAWAIKDLDELMQLVTDDIKYHASIGPDPGQTWIGKSAVRKGIQKMLDHDAATNVVIAQPLFFEDKAFCGWIYTGKSREIGCDLFTFREGKIAVKDAYRKCRH